MNEIKIIVPRNEVVMIDKEGKPLFVEALTEGEKFVEVGRFNDHLKPLWDDTTKDFIESATAEEIEAERPTLKKVVTEDEMYKDMVDQLFASYLASF